MGDLDEEGQGEEGDEEAAEEAPPPPPETRIDVEVPRIHTDLGHELHFVKLPNFLSVETRPYDPETYEDEVDEDEVLDEEGRTRLKLKVQSNIVHAVVMMTHRNYRDELVLLARQEL